MKYIFLSLLTLPLLLTGCTGVMSPLAVDQVSQLEPSASAPPFLAQFVSEDNLYKIIMQGRVRDFRRSGQIYITNLLTHKTCRGSFVTFAKDGLVSDDYARGNFKRSCLAQVVNLPFIGSRVYFQMIWMPVEVNCEFVEDEFGIEQKVCDIIFELKFRLLAKATIVYESTLITDDL